MKQLFTLTACLLSASIFAQSHGDFSSKKSGSWNDTTTWQVFNSGTLSWDSASSLPTLSNSVYIQNGDSLYMTGNGACKDLHINADLDANDSARIATGAFTLSISGKIRTYTGAKNASSIGGNNITGTNNSKRFYNTTGGGKLQFVGSTRYVVITGEGGVPANANGWNLEFALNPGDTAKLSANIRAGHIVIASGLVALDFNTSIRPDSGLNNTGRLQVMSGASLILGGGGSGSGLFRQSGQTFESFNLDSGAFLVVGSTANAFCNVLATNVKLNGTVISMPGRLLTNSAVLGAAPVNVFNNLKLRAATTLAENITVNGVLSLNSDNELILNSKTLTYGSDALVEYDGNAAQATSDVELPAVGGPSGIILNNTAGLSLHSSRTIAKLMRMVKGGLTLGANTLSYGSSTTLEYAGSTQQTTASAEFPSVSGPANLKINNMSGLILHGARNLAGDLIFSGPGILTTTGGATLTLGPISNVTSASASAFVNGPLEMTIASTSQTTKVFPIGKAGVYRPLTLQVTHDAPVGTKYKVELFNTSPVSHGLPSLIDSVSAIRHWNVTKGTGANINSAKVTLTYGAGDIVPDFTTVRVVKEDGANWANLGGMGTFNNAGSVTSDSNFTAMGDFALGFGTPDSIAPLITLMPRNPIIVTSSSQVAISALISDNRSVSSATLYYSVNSGSFTSASMTMSSGSSTSGIWTASIPAQANGSIVRYYVKATDIFTRVSFAPDSMATNSNYMVVNGGITSIGQLQFSASSSGRSIWTGDSLSGISVKGIVTSTVKSGDLGLVTIQDGSNPNSAVFVQANTGSGIELWNRGDSVVINSCVVAEINGITTLTNAGLTNHTVAGTGKTLPPFISNMNIDSIRLGVNAYTEAYEGMLMQFDSVYVISLDPDAPFNIGEFSFHKDSAAAAGLRANDQSNEIPFNFNKDSLKLKQLLPYIKGVLYYSINNWKLLPRNLADIDYKSGSGTSARGIFDHTQFSLYPNPANREVKLELINLLPSDRTYEVSILDILGRTHSKASFMETAGSLNETLDISSLSPGVYFCNISSGNASRTIKLLVTR